MMQECLAGEKWSETTGERGMGPQQETPRREKRARTNCRVAGVDGTNWKGQNQVCSAANTKSKLFWSWVSQRKTGVVVWAVET